MTPTILFLALIPPLLYATTNFIDKILLEKYFKEGGVGTLLMFSSLLSVLALPVILYVEPAVLDVSLRNAVLLSTIAIMDITILWFYLLALNNDEPSVVVLFYQLVPVMALGLGYLILDELPNNLQIISMAIILAGTTIVSFELDEENKIKFRGKTVIYMTIACFFWALETTLFKKVALEENVWKSLFWEHLVLVIIGIIMFLFIAEYRHSFLTALKVNSWKIMSANVANESIYMMGNVTVAFVAMLAPVSLILLNVPVQSIFVFIIAAILTLFFPHIFSEKIEKKHLIQKVLAIILTVIGSYLLVMAS